MFTSTPMVETTKERSVVKIESPELYFYCKARFLTIDDIKPYIDDRWD